VARDMAIRISPCLRRYAPLTIDDSLEPGAIPGKRHSAVSVPDISA
jgi:hypothetical protein